MNSEEKPDSVYPTTIFEEEQETGDGETPEQMPGGLDEEGEEEFQVRAPRPEPRKVDRIPADNLMKNIFGIMNELSKELYAEDIEPPSTPSSITSSRASAPGLGETSTLVKRMCILLVGLCLWMIRVVGIRSWRIGILHTLVDIIRDFGEELSNGDYDGEFRKLDSWVRSTGVVLLPEVIEWVAWLQNRIMDYPFIFGVLVGAVLV